MRTRCPACSTTFRVTSEQLRLKAGKVRCGQCLVVFNAFDSLIEEEAPPAPIPVKEAAVLPVAPPPPEPRTAEEAVPAVKSLAPADRPPSQPTVVVEETPAVTEARTAPEPSIREESVAESTQAARDAGLLAARELVDTAAYNRWAAGTLAGDAAMGRIESDEPAQPKWPFVVASLLLGTLLLCQLLYVFRTTVVQRLPEMAALYALAAVDVPLPKNLELVSIEVSDLQSDNARGLLVLQATLRNRATFRQAWPALELTLTDTHDTVISRRVLQAADYLPPGSDPSAFPARSDMAVQLWLEAKGIGAAGYRLYLFYP